MNLKSCTQLTVNEYAKISSSASPGLYILSLTIQNTLLWGGLAQNSIVSVKGCPQTAVMVLLLGNTNGRPENKK